uniref:Putative secreted protein n=1 Tax=Ixodes ricinus TaxID=34613 RepID=A0A6B0UAE4_IXORI
MRPGVEVSAAWCSTAPATRASPGPGAAALVTGTLPGRAPLSGQVRTVGRHSPGVAIQRQHCHRRRFPESLHRHPQSETHRVRNHLLVP